MSTKTTILLLVVFGCLLAGLFISRSEPEVAPTNENASTEPTYLDDALAAELVPDAPEQVNRIACRRAGESAEWVFERQSAADSAEEIWRMTAPLETRVATWDMRSLADRLLRAKYKVSQTIGEGGQSAATFGLDAPAITVTFTPAEGEPITIEVGSPVGARESYVRRSGSDLVATVEVRPDTLLKARALDYRDASIWNLDPEKITRFEVVEHSAGGQGDVTFAFRREGGGWEMESPVSAKATGKVAEAVAAVARLRTQKWVDDQADKLSLYGLHAPMLTVRITATAASEETAETHVLRVSSRSPIGEDTKVYVRAGDEPFVGLLMKTVTDKLRPSMAEWRDMTVVSEPVQTATAVTIEVSGARAELTRQGSAWFYSPQETPAEAQAVQSLLDAVAGLTAAAFVESDEAADSGFDKPQAVVTFAMPGRDTPLRLVVGAHTDKVAKRLVYLRAGEVVAKVRVQDVEKLLRRPEAYHDLTVLDLPAGGVEKLTIERVNRLADGRTALTFVRSQGLWSLAEPVAMDVRADALARWVTALAGLRAEAVVGVEPKSSAYGLDAPIANLLVEHKPPVQFEMREDPSAVASDAEGEPAKLVPVEVQPPNRTYELAIGERDGAYFARIDDRALVYRVGGEFVAGVFGEYLEESLLRFDPATVRRFSIRQGDLSHEFERADGGWRYAHEHDLPLVDSKVQNLLLQLRDMKSTHYVVLQGASPGEFGLDPAAQAVEVESESGERQRLSVSARACPGDPKGGVYANLSGSSAVVLVPSDVARRLAVDLDDLGKP